MFQTYFFQIKIFYLIILYYSNFHPFLCFALDSLKITVLNSRLPGPGWQAQPHLVLEYNNENTKFIRLLLTNHIAYIFRSNDETLCMLCCEAEHYVERHQQNIACLLGKTNFHWKLI